MDLIKDKNFWIILIIVGLLVSSYALASTMSWPLFFLGIFLALLILFIIYPQIGLYLMVFFYPFTYFEFVYKEINIPYVDLIAMILFAAWGLRTAYLFLEKGQKLSWKNFPAWYFMLLFVLAAFLSLYNVERENFNYALKYIFRPIIFFYLMYVILPFNIIDNLKKYFRILRILFVLGLGLSLMGVWSIIISTASQLKRAMPTEIFGIYPLGTNHNSLAEVLVCLIPFALILFWQEKDTFLKNLYLVGMIFMISVNLLTLSRAGWLGITLELLLLAILKYRQEAKNIFTTYLPYLSLVLLAPILYLMYKLFSLGFIAQSDVNRLDLIELAFKLFNLHPLFGNGVGTFTILVSQIKWYLLEYGQVIDSHGFIFKTLAETGLFGAITFSLLLAYIIYILLKAYLQDKKAPQGILLLGGFLAAAGGIAFQLFNTSYFIAKLWLPVGLALTTLKFSSSYFSSKFKKYAK
jgi:O-antigen ligase